MLSSCLSVLSLNTFGADDNVVYIEQMCAKNNVIFLSETWLKEEQKYIFLNCN
jgi:hypothetical protein